MNLDMKPRTTNKADTLAAHARAAVFILNEAEKHEIPTDGVSIRFDGFDAEVKFQLFTLDDFTTWALWLDQPIAEEPHTNGVIYTAKGELFDAPIEVTYYKRAAVPA